MDESRKERNAIAKQSLQFYAQAVFADKLKAQGFVSYNDDNLNWYRIVNGEVLQTIYIHSKLPSYSLIACLTYGVHPLFVKPLIPHKIIDLGWPGDREVENLVRHTGKNKVFNREHFVQCPATEESGAEYLDKVIFPVFAQTSTIEDAYNFFKQRYLASDWERIVTNDFIDMAIWLNDEEMYPYCKLSIYRGFTIPNVAGWTKSDAKRNQLQYEAIIEGERDEYLKVLEKRKTQILRKLEKGQNKT